MEQGEIPGVALVVLDLPEAQEPGAVGDADSEESEGDASGGTRIC